jgi:hypothetical protein
VIEDIEILIIIKVEAPKDDNKAYVDDKINQLMANVDLERATTANSIQVM